MDSPASIRKAYRDTAAAAMAAADRFAGFARLPSWVEAVNDSVLPAFGAFTLSDAFGRTTLDGEHQWDVKLTVAAKRTGLPSDLDDDLDLDLETIIATIITALHGASLCGAQIQCDVETSQTVVNADGGKRVGTVAVTFNCRCYWIF
ncbi:hypothetical protein [Ketogulonicigenium vulgare]|uniref:Uncharacterized protein n=1 Tax=Ketogulonicigenium vulgare (strain WSH-001) TaxID=759362 RepID=F9Y4L4_KETVW|nr:hypothetical protein [Ketogulonicigenium vulgare]ADO42375.1 hypothetical protein EIO_1232 [Ketogulonicigenium vulgare Y25]AEM40571.1 hypothetical protein KVU_0732 [Ketogulonicigenium vulgare WSH-001]ALJ80752.1 hypothetical protein KVH_05890 [Ketogulonicigenium vulgare]ANW33547.1 hypothetical protein KvSKV_05860 [Ketogulonicigenium vulgare]AOZ54287.1 hypothetical protein KVC_1270 [Ketogulonicigenium vulgare]